MASCEQMPGLSVLAHGESVWAYYQDLIRQLRDGAKPRYKWRFPDWIRDSALIQSQLSEDIVREYLVHHDCGKPYCRTVDEDGRQHFPDHARVSEELWRSVGGSETAARLMGMDMDIHLLKGDDTVAFGARPEAATLLLAGLAEVHSNAEMFGGIDSTGFKMKFKHLQRRGKRIVSLLSE